MLARPRFLRHEDDLGYLLRALRNIFLNLKRAESRRLRAVPLPDEADVVADPQARQPEAALEAAEVYGARQPESVFVSVACPLAPVPASAA